MRQFARYFRGYKKEIILGPLFKFLESVMELFMPIYITTLINNYAGVKTYFVGHVVSLSSGACIGLIFGQIALGYSFAVMCQYFAAQSSMGFGAALRADLFRKINNMPISKVDELGHNSLCSRLTSDVQEIQKAIAFFIRLAFRAPVLSIGAILMAFAINIKMGIIFIALVPVALSIIVLIMYFVVPRYHTLQNELDRIASCVTENTDGVRIVRAYNAEERESAEMHRRTKQYFDKAVRVNNTSALTSPITAMLMNSGVAIIVGVGGYLVNKGSLVQGDISAFTTYLSWILISLTILANLVVTFSKAFVGIKRVKAVLAVPDEAHQDALSDLPVRDDLNGVAVYFDNVSFDYGEGPVLSNISFTIKEGEKIGIIGGTGSGKSTLLALIEGCLYKTSGEIYLYGRSIESYSRAELVNLVSVCSQRVTLFEGSLSDNLRFGNPNATDEDLWKVLDASGSSEFVKRFPDGLNHFIAQSGGNVSGGQRQRLAIARTLLKDGRILIFDDSTSNLDFSTEAKVVKQLARRKRTLVLASQRTSAVRHMNHIFLMDGGKILAIGNHTELLNNDMYRKIYELQTSEVKR